MTAAMTESWVIGTGADCTMRITDEYASARHARIIRDRSGQVWIGDLGSTNGTFIRRASAGPLTGDLPRDMAGDIKVVGLAQIKPGDSIRIGRTWIPWTPQTRPAAWVTPTVASSGDGP